MLTGYIPIAILLILSVGLGVLVIVLGGLFGPKRPSKRKSAAYESGMQPIGPGTRRLPVRFYMVAVLFILFDIEVLFFLPWAVAFRDLGLYGLIAMIVFNIPIIVGFIYEWKKGALEWE
ncbi:MAG: NADH-quinone oxidoreductase subunit A [Chloroflexi bacterium]|nr:MAG: NADH-quinone oxidoreductase subunit A [Chloroflexota bacterium]MBL1196260.1 NADH-quinone oxidoreductase subunit A [Chloroflexota bacterium]NOH13555.1 NAD(P)H-quinone oxidoreductase subunit 3 [Chloroflexota bacterium]